MARRTFEMSFQIGGRLNSSFTSAFSGIDSRLERTQRSLRQLHADYRSGRMPIEQYRQSTEHLTRQLTRLQTVQKSVRGLQNSLSKGFNTAKSVASVAALGTAAVATGAALKSLNTAANYERQISRVSAISGATGSELKKLDDMALKLGQTTMFTATQAGEGMEYLALAGFKTTDIISAMPGMLDLAAAGSLDLGRAADITSDTMQAFGMKATEATHAADVFAYAQANANTNVEQMGEALKYSAPVANALKWSLEETSAATMVLANSGLKGSIAGQAFASSLARLAKPTKKMQKTMSKLNLEFFDANGKMKSMPELVKTLEKGMNGLTDKERSAAITTLFGAEAYKHWAILLSAGSDQLATMTNELKNADGAASKMAKTMSDNFAGSLNLLKASVETAQIKFMTPVLPVFQDLFKGIGSMIDSNIGGIEKAGERFASGLKDIFDPFSAVEPEKPKFADFKGNRAIYEEAMAQYQKDLAKFNKFSPMDFGDKVVYMLDEASAKMEEWLGGSGGESMNKIFTKLGEIAAKAWWNAFSGAVKASASNFSEGNIASGVGMGAVAWMLGGGLMVKGAVGAGKLLKGVVGGRGGGTVAGSAATAGATSAAASRSAASSTTPAATGSRAAARAASQTSMLAKVGSFGSKALKVAGKFALPLAAVGSVVDIANSKDKAKTTGESVGGIAGGLGGAKVGAAIGTAIAPGIGTAVGGVLGGLVGWVGGKWLGGKTVDTARGSSGTAKKSATQASSASTGISTEELQSAVTMSTNNFKALGMYAGQASGWMVGAFMGIKSSADTVKSNLDILIGYTAQASGWLGSLNNIQSAGQRVEQALNDLATRINNVQVPNVGGNKRVSYDG